MRNNSFKIIIVFLSILMFACDLNNEEIVLTGTVANITSCTGGPEPVYIIKLSDIDSIMTATLPSKFQEPNLRVQFKTTNKYSNLIVCTTDKVYPEYKDVYDVISLSN